METSQEEKNKLEKVAGKYGLKFIITHGSFATGKQRKGSDLDIAILGYDGGETRKQILKIHDELADIFGDGPERELDSKTLHGADSLFRYYVTRDGVLLYGNQAEYEDFKSYAWRDYVDSQDLRDLELTMTLAKQKMLTKLYA
ncbi:MAG: nucleotidyltransferase domain-containing protein [bacterium]|nr:nucleotidyltransferase domain-containing protein [bacterium]